MRSRDGRSHVHVISGDGVAAGRDGAFHLFVYGTLRSDRSATGVLSQCQRIGEASVRGTLYDLGEHPALMMYGGSLVRGEIWRCPADLLLRLDEYEGVERGLFRRVAVTAAGVACWTYVAGPALARQLTPDRRIPGGDWTPRPRG